MYFHSAFYLTKHSIKSRNIQQRNQVKIFRKVSPVAGDTALSVRKLEDLILVPRTHVKKPGTMMHPAPQLTGPYLKKNSTSMVSE